MDKLAAEAKKGELIVIRYKETFTFPGVDLGAYWHWAYCTVTRKGDILPIEVSKKEADEIIALHGLVRTHSDADGVVYDTPSRDFYQARGHHQYNYIQDVRIKLTNFTR